MKFLVLARFAQIRVDAGSYGLRAFRNGIRKPTHFPWRPLRVVACGHCIGLNLQCGVIAVCRVACLEWNRRIGNHTVRVGRRVFGDRS